MHNVSSNVKYMAVETAIETSKKQHNHNFTTISTILEFATLFPKSYTKTAATQFPQMTPSTATDGSLSQGLATTIS